MLPPHYSLIQWNNMKPWGEKCLTLMSPRCTRTNKKISLHCASRGQTLIFQFTYVFFPVNIHQMLSRRLCAKWMWNVSTLSSLTKKREMFLEHVYWIRFLKTMSVFSPSGNRMGTGWRHQAFLPEQGEVRGNVLFKNVLINWKTETAFYILSMKER